MIASLPESVSRVGASSAFPNEYPGMNYEFNWSLNADGVTPLKKSAFRITKPLDAKIAGLEPSKVTPLKVRILKPSQSHSFLQINVVFSKKIFYDSSTESRSIISRMHLFQ